MFIKNSVLKKIRSNEITEILKLLILSNIQIGNVKYTGKHTVFSSEEILMLLILGASHIQIHCTLKGEKNKKKT